MSAFEKNSLGWQLEQLQQRITEWWELQTTRFAGSIPELPWPGWLNSSLVQTLAKIIFWLLVAWLSVWIVWQIRRWFPFYLRQMRSQFKQTANNASKTSVKELLIDDWLRKAQQLQQRGNYGGACRCLYMAMLQQLHEGGIAPHQGSRTDEEYGQIIQQLAYPQPYQKLLMTHQELCFGDLQASLSLWETCQQAYREIDSK